MKLKNLFEKVEKLVELKNEIEKNQEKISNLRNELKFVKKSISATYKRAIYNDIKKEYTFKTYTRGKAIKVFKGEIRKEIKRISKKINELKNELFSNEIEVATLEIEKIKNVK